MILLLNHLINGLHFNLVMNHALMLVQNLSLLTHSLSLNLIKGPCLLFLAWRTGSYHIVRAFLSSCIILLRCFSFFVRFRLRDAVIDFLQDLDELVVLKFYFGDIYLLSFARWLTLLESS